MLGRGIDELRLRMFLWADVSALHNRSEFALCFKEQAQLSYLFSPYAFAARITLQANKLN